jgi:hypothetical protein
MLRSILRILAAMSRIERIALGGLLFVLIALALMYLG